MPRRQKTVSEKIREATGRFKLAYIARVLEMRYETLYRRMKADHFTDKEVEILIKEGIIQ